MWQALSDVGEASKGEINVTTLGESEIRQEQEGLGYVTKHSNEFNWPMPMGINV